MQIRAEEVRRNSQKMQALGELTGGVAHDFNNLLTVIAGNLDLLQNRKSLDADAQRYVSGAMRGVDRGTSLTQHLLAFGRRQPLAPRPVDLNRLATEMTSGMLRRSLGERIDIKIIESAGLWPAYADPAQIENAILNLAINARDAMPEGGKLTIETANVTLDQQYAEQNEEVTPGQYVMIAVSDAGTGMTPDVVARAFEPFFTTKDEGKGSGLGLAMVHGFARQSKGHVKIYSEPGNGTNVKLYLPRSQRAVTEESQAPATLPHGSATVLVVEDDTDVRRIAVAQLTDLGYRVLDAADAEAGLKIFTETGQYRFAADRRGAAGPAARPRPRRPRPPRQIRRPKSFSCRAIPRTRSFMTANSTKARYCCRSRSGARIWRGKWLSRSTSASRRRRAITSFGMRAALKSCQSSGSVAPAAN